MLEKLALWEAAKREMEVYQFAVEAEIQPKWDVPQKIAINAAISSRFGDGKQSKPMSIENYVDAASSVIEAGACGVHIDFSWITDEKGRRLDRDVPPVEAYSAVIAPLRARFGNDFVVNLNVLHGATFDVCISPARAGLAEVAPCAPGHPDAFMVPAIQTLEETGVKPELAIHSSGEIELAKRKLIDTGILKKPYNWLLLYGLPFNTGRTLISGTWVSDAQDMAQHMFLMVDQIRRIDRDSLISVCAAGRAGLYMTTLATMAGLHIRVGIEDTPWKHPNSDTLLKDNLEMFKMARDLAALLGRAPASANDYRKLIGKPELSTSARPKVAQLASA
jgi:3-keto-5-aminohexanoate cleavage enzyme